MPVGYGRVAPRPFTRPFQHPHDSAQPVVESHGRKDSRLLDEPRLTMARRSDPAYAGHLAVAKCTQYLSAPGQPIEHRAVESLQRHAAMRGRSHKGMHIDGVVTHRAA